MLKKVSENEEMRRSYRGMATARPECRNAGIREGGLSALSSVDLTSTITKCHLVLRVSSANTIAVVEKGHDARLQRQL